jgi:hypothetical protein
VYVTLDLNETWNQAQRSAAVPFLARCKNPVANFDTGHDLQTKALWHRIQGILRLHLRRETMHAWFAEYGWVETFGRRPDHTSPDAWGYWIYQACSQGRSKFAKHEPITPFEFAVAQLKRSPNTQDAVMQVRRACDNYFGAPAFCRLWDVWCDIDMRTWRLNLTARLHTARTDSQLPIDLAFLAQLQQDVIDECKTHYALVMGDLTVIINRLQHEEEKT